MEFLFLLKEYPGTVWTDQDLGIILGLFHIFVGLVVAFDFVTAGVLRRVKQSHFSFIFFWIYRYVSFVTLSFLWRPIYLNFIDSKFTKYFFFIAIPYSIVLFTLSKFNMNNVAYFPIFEKPRTESAYVNKYMYNHYIYYEDLSKLEHRPSIDLFSIPSKRVSGAVFEFFVRGLESDDAILERRDSSLTKFRRTGIMFSSIRADADSRVEIELEIESDSLVTRSQSLELNGLKDEQIDSIDYISPVSSIFPLESNIISIKNIIESTFLVKLNDMEIERDLIDCDFYMHPNNREKGMLCYFPIDSTVGIGRNYFTLEKQVMDKQLELDTIIVTIPFVYEGR